MTVIHESWPIFPAFESTDESSDDVYSEDALDSTTMSPVGSPQSYPVDILPSLNTVSYAYYYKWYILYNSHMQHVKLFCIILTYYSKSTYQ